MEKALAMAIGASLVLIHEFVHKANTCAEKKVEELNPKKI